MDSRTDMAILCRSSSSKPAFSASWITSSSASSTLSSFDSSSLSTDSVAPLLFSAIKRVAATWPKRIVRINYRQCQSQGGGAQSEPQPYENGVHGTRSTPLFYGHG